eukprot:5594439-Prymnesium_polylepis.1
MRCGVREVCGPGRGGLWMTSRACDILARKTRLPTGQHGCARPFRGQASSDHQSSCPGSFPLSKMMSGGAARRGTRRSCVFGLRSAS